MRASDTPYRTSVVAAALSARAGIEPGALEVKLLQDRLEGQGAILWLS